MVDLARAQAFLAAHLNGDTSDVAPLGLGAWLQAFAFRRAGCDYVIRFGLHGDDFARNRLAVPGFEQRLLCCQLHIGLAGLADQAYAGDWTNLEGTARRTLDLTE